MLCKNEKGKKIFDSVRDTINEYGMQDRIKEGVVLGLSGGADSVMLLYSLIELKRIYGEFMIRCVHVNHMIRGEDANADESFCRTLCEKLGIPLTVHCVDVPKLAKESKQGLEEAARSVRYKIFEEEADLISKDACIAVAHNATDNLETIIFNMMRGAGIVGLAGIKPMRDRIIRPLIQVSKKNIIEVLDSLEIEYVTDKTNLEIEYSRNYIRNAILPMLERLSSDPEGAGVRVSKNLRDDITYIEDEADRFYNTNCFNGFISTSELKSLPKALFFRVLNKIIGQKTTFTPERVHIEKIWSLIQGGDFEYSLPGKIRFVSRCGSAYIEDSSAKHEQITFYKKLTSGINKVPGVDSVIILSDNPQAFENYSNVYKIEIQATLPSDIINDGLYVRGKEDGDSYSYGGMTHKLKKLFTDRKIPSDKRPLIPVICDKDGVLWVPGFGVRGEEKGIKKSYIAIAKEKQEEESGKSFFITKRK